MADLTRENALKAMEIALAKGDKENALEMARLAKSLEETKVDRVMGQVNRSIANTVGGMVDFVNPFDEYTGSAVEGLKTGMTAIGAPPADREPEGILEGLGAGVGEAASVFAPAALGFKALSTVANPLVRGVATDAAGSMLSKTGLALEAASGGVSGAAGEAAQDLGAGPGWEAAARIAAPVVGLAAVPSMVRGAANLTGKTPLLGTAIKFANKNIREIKRAFAPANDEAAKGGAADRLRSLVGGEERALELSKGIDTKDEFGLTPAQQLEDPVLLGLERQARLEDPLVRERLDLRETQAREAAGAEITKLGGDVATAQTQFQKRIDAQTARMQAKIDQELAMGDESLEARGPYVSESQASINAIERIRGALTDELVEEKRLWDAVPINDVVPVKVSRQTAQEVIRKTPRAQQKDIPIAARELLTEDSGFGDAESVAELHGLYSSLRQTAREASSGPAPNNNKARLANEIADAILMDLDAVDGATPLGKSINEARVFSRALHEKFDTGAVGRMLNKTQSGDAVVSPEGALRLQIKDGPEGLASNKSITEAAPEARESVSDYLRGRFLDSAFDPTGTFSPKRAAAFARNNRELLGEYPELRSEFNRALTSRKNADVFAARTTARMSLIENESAAARFALAAPEKAALTIISARDPVKAAKSIMASARKDPTFFSEEGVKGAFTDYLISGGTRANGILAGDKLNNIMTDKRLSGALKEVFSPDELGRLKQITAAISKLDPSKVKSVNTVLDNPSNRMLEFVVTTIAARQGAALGAGTSGASLKTSAMASDRAKKALQAITNNGARKMVAAAIEDPVLMKALLSTPEAVAVDPVLRNAMAPFLTGGAATVETEKLKVNVPPPGNNYVPETPEETKALDEQIRGLMNAE